MHSFKAFMDFNGNGRREQTDAAIGHNGRSCYVTAAVHDMNTYPVMVIPALP